ncbi:MAG TPA: hypothetical protein VFN85_06060 [Solirubrobacterales bacterium]|nr:hypothetical protein [Solirubrobacterales bacterium]
MAAISTPLIVLLGLAGVALGALGAYLLARRKVSHAAAAIPLVSLLVALRPLLLPLLAAVLVGLFHLGAAVLIAGAALLTFAAAWLLVVPEASRLRAAGAWDLRLLQRHGPWIVLVAAALTVGGALLASDRSLESIGGAAAVVLILALALWLLAFVLRLVSHCSSWLRTGVALVVALTGYRLAAAIGLVPGGDLISDHLPFLDWLLPVLAAALMILEAVLDAVAAARGEDPRGREQTERLPGALRRIRGGGLGPKGVQLFQGLGLGVALLASGVLLLAAWTGLLQTNQPGKRLSTDTATEAAEAAAPPAPGSYPSDEALAAAYSPVLALTRAERWSPIPYGGYVHGATLSGPLPGPLAPRPSVAEKLGVGCPHLASAPCFRLSIRCPTGDRDCSHAEPHPTRSDEGLYREGAVYVRVARRGAEERLEERRNTENLRRSDRWPPQLFRSEGPYAKRLSILLQYWYFYRYDEWETHVFAGKLVQRHEGDWEAVTIGLSNEEPLFVAYSAHCAGSWVPWEEAEISDRLGGRTHPVVAVAEGSHANYPYADQKRAPDWAGCQGAPQGTTTLLSYASNIRDKTEYGWEWYPADGGIHLVSEAEPPMSFPGYWGASEDTTLYGFFKTTRLGEGHGPETPSEQPLWRTPVTKIFCGNYSQPHLPPSAPHDYCPKSASKE